MALLFAESTEDRVARGELEALPAALHRQIARSFAELPSLDAYAGASGATVVARGVNYATAHEIALKVRELSGLAVEAYSPADLMHGPIAAIATGWPVVLVAPSGPAYESVAETLPALVERGAHLLIISDVPEMLARADTPLQLVPGVPEWLTPMVATIPGQVTAMRLAQFRQIDIDVPHGLRKITTR